MINNFLTYFKILPCYFDFEPFKANFKHEEKKNCLAYPALRFYVQENFEG